ncbi:MAG TPA: glycosyltransferase [Planctomycetota bacterium]|jgi:glycosyltransferase involved in cell wall biosynthesis|nr:glycosyltransferase [Planctomycetota bacterium]OQC20721.1 MAG: putative glycosyltransferase EpsE [Planctomycetes bacterium ADurb.Bin069]HNR98332.1 glycosyltransferase [Planctomycetota bacterium]HNU24650.1 glycosyltransferase [Planctomycetota bacterium]HOE28956.1 glycosyltransferase [Planctomycetota bacterium]
MTAPRVRSVLPAYNAAATLGRALASLAAQTFADWECLIVDDGSTDATGAVGAEWARRDGRMRMLAAPRGGIVRALNAGFRGADAPLLARMDADDESLPDRLARQVAFLDANPDIGIVSCLVEHVPAHGAQQGFGLYVDWTNGLRTPEDHALNRFVESPLVHPTAVWRRDCAPGAALYRESPRWPEDYDLWLRLMHAGVKAAKVPAVLYRWHDPPGRLSRTDPRYSVESFYECKAHYLAIGPLADRSEVGVWGAGRPARLRAALLERHGVRIRFYVDIDPRKTGKKIAGRPVLAPEDLAAAPPVPLLAYVGSRGARQRIRAFLARMRRREGVDFWCAA